MDSARNIYIADYNNHRIRKVDSSGKITTIAGNGTYGYSGDGGLATLAQLNHPWGVTVDSVGTSILLIDLITASEKQNNPWIFSQTFKCLLKFKSEITVTGLPSAPFFWRLLKLSKNKFI